MRGPRRKEPPTLDEEVRRELAAALLTFDSATVGAVVSRLGKPGLPAFQDNAASVAGLLFERFAGLRGIGRARILTMSDQELADWVLVPLRRATAPSAGEARSISRQAPRVLREWRRVPGLWPGGGEDSWLFAYVIPAGVHGLTEAGVLDVQRLVDDWMTDTRDPSVDDS